MTDPNAPEAEEELVDYEEEEAPDAGAAKAGGGDAVKKGYVGIHSSGFKDFLLKPELLRAIVDCGFEHPSEGAAGGRPCWPWARPWGAAGGRGGRRPPPIHARYGSAGLRACLGSRGGGGGGLAAVCAACDRPAALRASARRAAPPRPNRHPSSTPRQCNTSASPRPSWAWTCCVRRSRAWARRLCSCCRCCSSWSRWTARSGPSWFATPESWPTRRGSGRGRRGARRHTAARVAARSRHRPPSAPTRARPLDLPRV